MQKTFEQIAYTILINEILPRNNKYNLCIHPKVGRHLSTLEYHKLISRKQTREILDNIVV